MRDEAKGVAGMALLAAFVVLINALIIAGSFYEMPFFVELTSLDAALVIALAETLLLLPLLLRLFTCCQLDDKEQLIS